MTLEEKYQEALDALQNLLDACGVKTKVWEKAREIVDRERPILERKEPMFIRMTYQNGQRIK